MARAVFTIVTPIESGKVPKDLDECLAHIARSPDDNPHLELGVEARPEVHFASFVIFDRETNQPILVFENCIDAPVDEYLGKLADLPGIDDIYRHCKGYPPSPNPARRFEYLRRHVRRPQLYHLGAPYRSAQSIAVDQEFRTSADLLLKKETAGLLSRQLTHPPSGTLEYWRWELALPWLVGLTGMLAIGLEAWLIASIDWSARRLLSAVFVAGAVVVAAGAFRVANGGWRSAPLEVRRRARSWVLLATTTAVIVAAAWWYRPDVVEWLWNNRRALVLSVAAALGVLLFIGVWGAVRQRLSDRIAAVRTEAGAETAVPIWMCLRSISKGYRLERPTLVRRFWNFRWWLVPVVLGFVPVWLFAGQGRLLLVLAVLALMGTAAWMAALTGWPSRPTDPGRRPRGLRFVLSSTVLGALLVFLLVKLGLPTYVVAFLTGAVAVGLLGVPVSLAPKALLAEPGFDAAAAAAMLRTVKAQEDHEVQNHMAVLAIVDAPWRRVTLKAFLYTLNYLFYRSVLPDLWGGKLFGLSTVHCAQWVLLEDGRFLFLSNYDHTWNTYLNDFGAHLRSGIQKIWGQCRDNPGTGDLEAFKRYVRRSMVPYAVWYRAYPDMTVRQVWNTEHLRAALDRDLPEEKVIKSLRRLGAAPKVLPEISHAAQ